MVFRVSSFHHTLSGSRSLFANSSGLRCVSPIFSTLNHQSLHHSSLGMRKISSDSSMSNLKQVSFRRCSSVPLMRRTKRVNGSNHTQGASKVNSRFKNFAKGIFGTTILAFSGVLKKDDENADLIKKIPTDGFSIPGLDEKGPLEISKKVKLVIFVPNAEYIDTGRTVADTIREALAKEGAGDIGDYAQCSFMIAGEGRWQKRNGDNQINFVNTDFDKEQRIEVIVDIDKLIPCLLAARRCHPYQEMGYDIYLLVQLKNMQIARPKVLPQIRPIKDTVLPKS